MTISTRKYLEDVGSEEVRLLREQVNRLTTALQAMQDAAVTDGDTFQANVAALTELDDLEDLQPINKTPTPPRIPKQ